MRRSLTAVFEKTPRLQHSGVGIHKVKQQSYNEIWTNNTFIFDVMEHYSHMIDVRLKLLRLKFPSNPSPSLYRTPNLEEREETWIWLYSKLYDWARLIYLNDLSYLIPLSIVHSETIFIVMSLTSHKVFNNVFPLFREKLIAFKKKPLKVKGKGIKTRKFTWFLGITLCFLFHQLGWAGLQ